MPGHEDMDVLLQASRPCGWRGAPVSQLCINQTDLLGADLPQPGPTTVTVASALWTPLEKSHMHAQMSECSRRTGHVAFPVSIRHGPKPARCSQAPRLDANGSSTSGIAILAEHNARKGCLLRSTRLVVQDASFSCSHVFCCQWLSSTTLWPNQAPSCCATIKQPLWTRSRP